MPHRQPRDELLDPISLEAMVAQLPWLKRLRPSPCEAVRRLGELVEARADLAAAERERATEVELYRTGLDMMLAGSRMVLSASPQHLAWEMVEPDSNHEGFRAHDIEGRMSQIAADAKALQAKITAFNEQVPRQDLPKAKSAVADLIKHQVVREAARWWRTETMQNEEPPLSEKGLFVDFCAMIWVANFGKPKVSYRDFQFTMGATVKRVLKEERARYGIAAKRKPRVRGSE